MRQIPIEHRHVIKDNKLVLRVRDKRTKVITSQGKRVGKDVTMSRAALREYVTKGSIECAAQLRKEHPEWTLWQIVEFIKSQTGTGRL